MKNHPRLPRAAAVIAALPLTLLAGPAAQAHPGHGLIDASSLLHGLEAEHLWPGLAVLALAGLVVHLRRRRRASRAKHTPTRMPR